jgi:hypothetical protein
MALFLLGCTYNNIILPYYVYRMGSDKKQDEIHAVSLNTGLIIHTYKLWVHRRGDWESIALGPCSSSTSKDIKTNTCLYIQDAGDNASQRCSTRDCGGNGERDHLYIFKFPEPDLSNLRKTNKHTYDGSLQPIIRVVILRYNYNDPSWPTNHADSEAMFVDWTGANNNIEGGGKKGDIYVMTKQPYDRKDQRIGKIPVEEHENLTTPSQTTYYSKGYNNFVLVKAVTQASVQIPWTGADMSRDGTLIAARRESKVYFFARDVQMGQTVEDAMSSPPCSFISKTDMTGLHQKQSEAITFLGSSKYSFAETSECYKKGPCKLPVPSFKLKFPS